MIQSQVFFVFLTSSFQKSSFIRKVTVCCQRSMKSTNNHIFHDDKIMKCVQFSTGEDTQHTNPICGGGPVFWRMLLKTINVCLVLFLVFCSFFTWESSICNVDLLSSEWEFNTQLLSDQDFNTLTVRRCKGTCLNPQSHLDSVLYPAHRSGH